MIDNFENIKNIPVTNMTIGDILKYFEVVTEREHNSEEEVKRSMSEVANRFMVEAMYKYYNPNEYQSETSKVSMRKDGENWEKGGIISGYFYPPNSRAAIVRELTNKFKDDLIRGKILFSEENKNFFFKTADHPTCKLTLSIEDGNLVITYYIGDTVYTKKILPDSSDFVNKSDEFWKKYGEIIISSSNELVAQINEGH
jgi:hypothetical protein